MKKESREIVRTVAFAAVCMMALPVAYRAWVHFHPPPAEPQRTVSGFFAKAAEERASKLLQTPLSKWTEFDRKTEPRICAWLEAHAKRVLPWEWTDEARRKDPDGYRRLWIDLFEEQGDELDRLLKAGRKKLKSLERALWIAETIHVHHTNQLAVAEAYVATNSFPLTLNVERLSKGWLWGWNAKAESVSLDRYEAFGAASNGWLVAERGAADAQVRTIADLKAQVKALQGRLSAIGDLRTRNGSLSGLEEVRESLFVSETCNFLKAEETREL